ncbi:MAG: DUF58 domain-containing protein [Planctomycetes bacterium]|nr:DUF58 domain-containing protein [Planctomycetota bacterium]
MPIPAGPHPLLDPAFLRRLDALRPRLVRGRPGFAGERASHRPGGRVEFLDHRPYAHGDDLSQLDWNAVARTERLVVKEYAREQDFSLLLLLDATASMAVPPAKWLAAARLAAALGFLSLVQGGVVTLRWFGARAGSVGAEAPIFRGRRAMARLLGALAAVTPAGVGDAGDPLARAAGDRSLRAAVVVMSDFTCDPRRLAPAAALAGRGIETLLLHLAAPEELRPGFSGSAALADAESGRAVVVAADRALLARYAAAQGRHCETLRRLYAPHGVRYELIDAGWPIEEVLFRRLAPTVN